MSRGDTALLVVVVITLFFFLPPGGEFFLMVLKRLSLAGIAALGVLVFFLLFRGLKR